MARCAFDAPRWSATLAATALACVVNPDYTGTSYQCADGTTCPSGQVCVANVCVVAPPADGAPADGADGAPTPDGHADAWPRSFTDDQSSEFGAGSFDDTEWASGSVQLVDSATSGVFTSRVFDSGAVDAAWQSIAWRPRAPYLATLPGARANETGFAEDGVDMADNILLLRLDAQSNLPADTLVPDASGRNNHATVKSTGSDVVAAPGRIGSALDFSPANYLAIDITPASDLQFGTDDLTWAVWAKTSESCDGLNKVFLGGQDASSAPRTHVWLGCTHAPSNSDCPGSDSNGRAAGSWHSRAGGSDGDGFCGATRINDGSWHHIVLVKSGHDDALLTVYVDGQEDGSVTTQFDGPLDFDPTWEFGFAAFSEGTYQADVALDEVAIWKRALSEPEVVALYRRGARRLLFQVRACDEATCAGATSFVGPDGTPLSGFTHPIDALGPGVPSTLPAEAEGQFLQYRVEFETDDDSGGPELEAVTVAY